MKTMCVFEPSIEDTIKAKHKPILPSFAVRYQGKTRWLSRHEAYQLVILALTIINDSAMCEAIETILEEDNHLVKGLNHE